MRFCFVHLAGEPSPRLAVERGNQLFSLPFQGGLRKALEELGPEALFNSGAEATKAIPSEQVKAWLPPVHDPRTLRDFYAFEQHVKTCRANRGLPMPPEWYQAPVFYFSNPTTLKGHNQPVRRPRNTQELDFELEIAAVIGKEVVNVSGQAAEDAIFGYTIFNDLSARDIQRQEMKCGLGPAKGKDFASVLGPVVVTCEHLAPRRLAPGRYDLSMKARKNGVEISRGNMKEIHFDFTRLVERACADAPLFPGDILGSGTVGTGCILELGPEKTGGWLQPGDVLELEIERIGVLRTSIV
ncbi:MAG: fumarylacetoacetate hydrolase family protein [Gemmataceae bacterium]|nr:fumarylacetoacetate hydrolase family protein [Gemmataceae bacterium]